MKKRIGNTKLFVDILPLTTGIQKILLDMARDGKDPLYPIKNFETYIVNRFNCSFKEAELITEKILSSGIIRMSIYDQCFTL